MIRREFLKALSCLPLLGWLKPSSVVVDEDPIIKAAIDASMKNAGHRQPWHLYCDKESYEKLSEDCEYLERVSESIQMQMDNALAQCLWQPKEIILSRTAAQRLFSELGLDPESVPKEHCPLIGYYHGIRVKMKYHPHFDDVLKSPAFILSKRTDIA